MWPVTSRIIAVSQAPHRRYLPARRPEAEPRVGGPLPSGPRPGLYAGEPDACRRAWRHFGAIFAHLVALFVVALRFRVEGRGFQLLMGLTLAALPIHYLLPYRLKKPFFVAASLAGMFAVFGTDAMAVVLPVGALLIGLCYLPVRWEVRAGLVACVAVACGLMHAGVIDAGVSAAVWPVLATLFMFRMILFLYELKHATKPESPLDAVAYFALLPNAAFLHFPVVDYRTLQRGYFGDDVHALQRRGLAMMTNGLAQLLVYRLIYHRMLIPAADVHDPGSLVVHIVGNYLLYLRVSGQFHVACGMLHLFGWKLPETHRRYLLATGFTDYWRRINIYWKDFMVRTVFNPVAFRLKRRPQAQALAAATVAVFVATWALHAYQSFWLRGRWGLSATDALFWGILGALVLVNVQLDAARPRRRSGAELATLHERAVRAAKILGTFSTIAVLWSLWSSPTLGAWLAMFRRAFD